MTFSAGSSTPVPGHRSGVGAGGLRFADRITTPGGTGILGGIEVVKSLTPEMDAEGLGGVVNILPRTMPQGHDTLLDASLGTGLEPLRGTPVYQGDITAGMRFGLGDGMPKTLDQIGDTFGVTRERIRQIESKTMAKLRHPSRSQSLRDYLE